MSAPKIAASASRQINAVVVSAGLMEKTVKVRVGVQKWNNHIRKHFSRTQHLLVHDPRTSLRIGDIISISPGYRASKNVHHIVNSILAPFGEPIDARPPIPTRDELAKEKAEKERVREENRLLAIETAKEEERVAEEQRVASGRVESEEKEEKGEEAGCSGTREREGCCLIERA